MQNSIINLVYPFGLLPFNNAYSQDRRSGRRFLTKQGKEFKQLVEKETWIQHPHKLVIDRSKVWVEVEYFIYSPKILTKDGYVSLTKGDVDGQIKLFQDAVCSTLGFDDALITQDFRKQIHSSDYQTIMIIKLWPLRTINDML
jgi:Holliday junction resolvase RusA-like endonuclease